jgi:hypothetical protein
VKESKTFEGRWWIFGTEKPEHFGVLHYSPEKGLRLEVKIAQSFGFADILLATDRADFPEVIQGRDTGAPIARIIDRYKKMEIYSLK